MNEHPDLDGPRLPRSFGPTPFPDLPDCEAFGRAEEKLCLRAAAGI